MKPEYNIKASLLVLLLFFIESAIIAQPFANEIRDFQKEDSIHNPRKGQVLFIGSSSFRLWKDLPSYFPNSSIINRSFGGSTLADQLYYFDKLLPPYSPRQIVIYCGENDIAASDTVTAALVFQRFSTLFRNIRSLYPKVPVLYISIKPSPSRWHLKNKMMEANMLIRNFLEKKKRTKFVNVWDLMLDKEGKPDSGIFIDDKLHMNAKGYALWKKALEPYLIKD